MRLWIMLAASALVAAPAMAFDRPTIAEIVSLSGSGFDNDTSDFDVLLRAVQTANLTGLLNDPDATLTVFAPNDGAFVRRARDLGFSGQDEEGAWLFLVNAFTQLGNGDPIPVLTDVLAYHVVDGRLPSFAIRRLERSGTPIQTLLVGATVFPSNGTLVDNDPGFRDARRIFPRDIRASNGLIQVIDNVLLPIDLPSPSPQPGTIAALVAQSGGAFDDNAGDFDLLLTALQTADLVDVLGNSQAQFSVFAPTDAAFIQTARDLGYAGSDEAGAWQFLVGALTGLGMGDPVPLLTDILLYHVLPYRVDNLVLFIVDLFNIGLPTALSGTTVSIDGAEVVDNDPEVENPNRITPRPIPTVNGVVYPIDRVLLPIDL